MTREGRPEEYTGEGYFTDGALRPEIFKAYLPLYEAALAYLPVREKCSTVVDLGCGVGCFAKVLFDRGCTKYVGVDFSPAMIEKAKICVPKANFVLTDLRSDEVREIYRGHKIFVCLETLEHVIKDVEVLEKIPSRSLVILSVPQQFDTSMGFHVRYFDSKKKVINRYKHLLDFIESRVLYEKTKSKVFLFKTIRK